MRKKFLVTLVAAMLSICCISGCGNGTRQENADGTVQQENADGTVQQENADGTVWQENADGTVQQENADGTVQQENADRTVQRETKGSGLEAGSADAGDKKPENGTYTIELIFGGGSGKSTILSPATITVDGDKMTASIEWSSSNYDYMIVDGEKYLPTNTEGNSRFEIPVSALDTEITVIGDTVAMSKAHEVEYTITFQSDTMKAAE